MLKLSERSNLAIHALGYMASKNGIEPVPVAELAAGINASQSHLAKVMQVLVKQGFLTSYRGAKGGFVLARKPCDIKFLEVYEAVEGPLGDIGCLLPSPLCPGGNCLLKETFNEITETLRRNLSEINICAFKA